MGPTLLAQVPERQKPTVKSKTEDAPVVLAALASRAKGRYQTGQTPVRAKLTPPPATSRTLEPNGYFENPFSSSAYLNAPTPVATATGHASFPPASSSLPLFAGVVSGCQLFS